MKDYSSIVSAKALPGFCVQVLFETGERGVFDCRPYLADAYWKRLADPAFFRLVRVECGTLVWPGDIDLDPEDIWANTLFDKVAATVP